MAIANDTFVEGINTVLELHTPTGPNPGSAWTSVGGAQAVIAAIDKTRGTPVSGNRFQMDDDLEFDQMDVQIAIDFDVTVIPGDGVFGGPTGRHNTTVPAVAAYEFSYNWNVGVTFGSFVLQDSGGSDAFEEDWGVPTTSQLMLLQIRDNDHRGFADGIEKVSRVTNVGSGDQSGGQFLGSFTGGINMFGDNYESEGIAPPTPLEPWPEYGQPRAAIGNPSVYGATIVRS